MLFLPIYILFVNYIDNLHIMQYNKNMIDLTNKLTEIGLSEKQASVYAALLTLGFATPSQIALEAKIKRPTAYVVLDGLVERGLIDKIPKGKTLVYSISNPKLLVDSIQDKAKTAQTILPLLVAAFGGNRHQPTVRLYAGAQGVVAINKQWRQKAMQKDSPKEIWWFGSLGELNNQFKGLLAQNYQIWNKYNIKAKELVGSSKYDYVFANQNQSKTRQFRHIPKKYNLTFDFGIYGNQVGIFQLKNQPFALLIESVEIADSFRILYDLAWQQAKD